MSLLSSLIVGNAEFLALGVYFQMIREHSPLIYAVLSTVADMRTGNYASGAIETGIMQMAHTEMARFYNVPSGGYIGLTNSHCNDAQNGFETGMNTTAALMSGADLFNMGGLLDSLTTFDFAKAVIDNEIAMMLKKAKEGVPFSEEDLCLDLIKEVGPGGLYMDQEHTVMNMRKAAYYPKLAARDMRSQWKDAGRPDISAKAMEEAKRILSADNSSKFPAELDKKIKDHFKGIVAGDALPIG